MIGTGLRHTGNHHVRVAHSLDLLKPEGRYPIFEAANKGIQLADDCGRLPFAGVGRETHQVREQHRDLVHAVCDDMLLAALQTVGDRPRQNVEQQSLGASLLGNEQ
jgi:hypothetical protein